MTRLFEANPFIIAEVGSNWTSYNDCKESIDMAKACGADAVKFQLFDYKSLYGRYPNLDDSPVAEAGFWIDEGVDRGLKSLDDPYMPISWIPKLAERCKVRGIEFMCTGFSPELVKAIDPYVEVHKLASSDLTDPLMLEAVRATGKPVLLSCGASSPNDIKLALHGHEKIEWKGFDAFNTKLVLLYCNSAYPSKRHNLFVLDELKRFGAPVGLSDHSLDVIYAPLSAVKHFGAIVIEKHFKLRDDMKTPDAPHSLDSDEFQCMVDNIRGKRLPVLNPTKEEHHMLFKNNRRLIATQDLKPGTVLKRGENYGAFRALEDDSNGLSPFFWELLEGKAVGKHGVTAGNGISPKDVE